MRNVLGHYVSFVGIKVDPIKIEFISNIPVPKTQKYDRSFPRHVGCYKQLIENFMKIAYSLFKLLTKDNEFLWNIPCQTCFENLKEKFSIAHGLSGLNWSIPFHISINASDRYLGAVLGKKGKSIILYHLFCD
jgi:hypothetical protein